MYKYMECSAIKKQEILSFEKNMYDLEDMMLNEISQAQKAKYHMLSLICENLTSQTHSSVCRVE
jgi:hypothetical protein